MANEHGHILRGSNKLLTVSMGTKSQFLKKDRMEREVERRGAGEIIISNAFSLPPTVDDCRHWVGRRGRRRAKNKTKTKKNILAICDYLFVGQSLFAKWSCEQMPLERKSAAFAGRKQRGGTTGVFVAAGAKVQ